MGSILFCPKGSVPRARRGQSRAPFPADTEYYYKRIEEAIAELKSNMAKWNQLIDGTGLESVFSDMSGDADNLDRKCESVWLKHNR